MSGTIQLRDLDPLHGGQVEISLPWTGPAPQTCPLVIRRGTTKDPFLGAGGWQAVEHFFQPDLITVKDDRLGLVLGPALVDNALRDDDLVQISLPEIGAADVVAWRGITRSVTVVVTPRRAEAPMPPPSPPRPPVLIVLSTPDQPDRLTLLAKSALPLPAGLTLRISRDATPTQLGAKEWQDGAHEFAPVEREDGPDGARLVFALPAGVDGGPVQLDLAGAQVTAELPQPVVRVISDDHRRHPIKLAAVLLVLLALAGAGWWWLEGRQAPVPPDLSATDGTGPVSGSTAAQTATPASPPSPPPIPAPQAAYEQAMAAIEAGDCPAARQHMLAAVDGDYAPALLAWAEAQDSLDFQPCLTETQNDISALTYLKRACTAGAEGAKEALARLTVELQRRAAQNDDTAQDVLRLAVPGVKVACNG